MCNPGNVIRLPGMFLHCGGKGWLPHTLERLEGDRWDVPCSLTFFKEGKSLPCELILVFLVRNALLKGVGWRGGRVGNPTKDHDILFFAPLGGAGFGTQGLLEVLQCSLLLR